MQHALLQAPGVASSDCHQRTGLDMLQLTVGMRSLIHPGDLDFTSREVSAAQPKGATLTCQSQSFEFDDL